jgi:hypothetical protein
MHVIHRTVSKTSLILITALSLSGCAEYIIAEAAVNAAYHGAKAINNYSKSKNESSGAKSSVVKSTKIDCALPDGKIYRELPGKCTSGNGLIVNTDAKTKFGCRKSDGNLFAATYNSCIARKGWIDNKITVECSYNINSAVKQEITAFDCLSLGYKVIGVPKQQTAKIETTSEAEGKCELDGSGYVVVPKAVCSDLQGKWSL